MSAAAADGEPRPMPGVTPATSTEPTDTTSPRPPAETGEPPPPGHPHSIENTRSGMRGERPCASAPPGPPGLPHPPGGGRCSGGRRRSARRPVLSTLRGAGDDFVHNGRTHDHISSTPRSSSGPLLQAGCGLAIPPPRAPSLVGLGGRVGQGTSFSQRSSKTRSSGGRVSFTVWPLTLTTVSKPVECPVEMTNIRSLRWAR